MKLALSFVSGLVVCGLLLFGVQSAIPTLAQTDTDNVSTDNFSLVELLPDIEKIYREALITPLYKAEAKIYDDDIADFYHTLLERTALNMPEGEPE